jgi:nucleotide-binding universal stress UspA family protein
MEGIIVGVDESTYAQTALRWAADFGVARGVPVTALMAWDFVYQHHTDPDAPLDPDYDAKTASKVLDELVQRAVGENHDLATLVVNDRPGPALIQAAGDDAALIVVGARGMGGFRGLVLGSVSRYVLHAASVPVAVIRSDPANAYAPVVVGVDGSEPSRRALRWAIDYSRRRHVSLIAVHAWVPPYNPLGLWTPADLEKQAKAAQHLLDQELSAVDQSGLVAPIDRRVREAHASAALLDAGGVASMIVVGSRGRGQLAQALLGSVSDEVSRYATCPVVVVP